jgi:tetratricopeptide (TPR) repeat protein
VYSKNPNSPRAMNVLGISLMNRGEYERSKQLLEECHRIAPQYLPCIVHLSMAHAHRREYARGLELLKFGHEVDPNYVHINFHLGIYYKDYFGDFDRARYHFQKVYEVSSGRFFQGTIKLGEMALEERKYEDAIKIASSILELDLSNGDAWDIYAKAFMLKGDLDAAARIFQKLLASVPDSQRYLLNVANVFERKGDLGRAREVFEHAVQRHPDLVQAWEGLARVSKSLGDKTLLASTKAKLEELLKGKKWQFLPSMFLTGEKPAQLKPAGAVD